MRNQKISEEEAFYQSANEFVDRNRQELELGEAYAKFYFWKSVFGSVPGQFALLLAFVGLWKLAQTGAIHSFLFMLGSISGGNPLIALALLGVVLITIAIVLNRIPTLGWITLISLAVYGIICVL